MARSGGAAVLQHRRSGGAVVGVVDVQGMRGAGRLAGGGGVEEATAVLRAAYHAEGYVFVRLAPFEGGRQ